MSEEVKLKFEETKVHQEKKHWYSSSNHKQIWKITLKMGDEKRQIACLRKKSVSDHNFTSISCVIEKLSKSTGNFIEIIG